MRKFTLLICCILFCAGAHAQLMLFNNGPMINKPGSGSGGAHVSALTGGMTLYGFNQDIVDGYKMAEDFRVPAAGWTIDSLVFFGYQTQASPSTISTINEVKIGIWDGSPDAGASVIYGDTGVNVLATSTWSGIYRTTSTDTLNAQRAVMRNVVATPGLILDSGTYFVSWQMGGTLASGPWAPPIALRVITATGNGIQFVPSTQIWQPAKDTTTTPPGAGTGDIQGLPFIVYGHQDTTGTGILNDSCFTAIDLSASMGQPVGVVQTTGPYNNDSASTGADDPATGFGCFGEATPSLDNTLWFSFVGDGGYYFIETGNCGFPAVSNYIDDGDTQIGIYTGTCGALVPEACNEDGPSATASTFPAGLNLQTTAGTTYYMLIDGYNLSGVISTGQFCVNITRLSNVLCGNASITAGTGAANDTMVCFNDTLRVNSIGPVLAPTVGDYPGFSWLITSADISGNPDPLNSGSLVGGSGIAASGQNLVLINNGTPFAAGDYFFTPVVYGNAIDDTTDAVSPPTYVFHLVLDPACTYTGTSISIHLLAQGDPFCGVAIEELMNTSDNNLLNIYPVPVKNNLNFTYKSISAGDVDVTVNDISGRTVLSKKSMVTKGANVFSFDMSKQCPGVYYVKVISSDATRVGKFVKE